MIYTKRKNIGELLSPYLQKKALNFLEKEIYKQNSDATYLIQKIKELETKNNNLKKELEELKKEIYSLKMKEIKANQAKVLYTSKIRSAIQKAKRITSQNFQKS
ncbi:7810_t:CDS:1, partial [Scutellospora calospora]